MPLARAAGRLIIQRLVPLGYSNRYIMRAVRSSGYGYRTKLLNADINNAAGRYNHEFHIRKLNVNDVVPDYLMTPGLLGQPSKYMVHYKTTYYNPEIDQYFTLHRSMYTNDKAKIGDWIEADQGRTLPESPPLDLELINQTITGVDIAQ